MTVKCPNCGIKAESVDNKCPICDFDYQSQPKRNTKNKKKYIAASSVLFVIITYIAYQFFSIPSISQKGKDAYMALKQIEAHVSSGVTFQNYSVAVSKATLECDVYSDSKGRKNKGFTNYLLKALFAYQYSKEIWNKKINSDFVTEKTFLQKEELSKYAKLFPSLYEEAKDSEKLKGFNDDKKRVMRAHLGEKYSALPREISMQVLWREASKELRNANSLIDE